MVIHMAVKCYIYGDTSVWYFPEITVATTLIPDVIITIQYYCNYANVNAMQQT